MKVGDILINRWAGHIDCRYFIYLGTSGDYINGLEIIQGRPRKVRYYRSSLNEFIRDTDQKALEVVGHTDFLNVAKLDLQKIKELEDKQ